MFNKYRPDNNKRRATGYIRITNDTHPFYTSANREIIVILKFIMKKDSAHV